VELEMEVQVVELVGQMEQQILAAVEAAVETIIPILVELVDQA
jgi:hypothetical protein